MKILSKSTVIFILILFSPNLLLSQTPPPLGVAADFVLFTSVGAATAAAPLSHITGDVGSNSAGGTSGYGNINGTMHTNDATTTQAAIDLGIAYTTLSNQVPGDTLGTLLGFGQVLLPNVYLIDQAASLTDTLVLDGGGDPSACFVIKINGALTTASYATITLTNGTKACNVFWKVYGAVTMQTYTYFKGTVIAEGAIDLRVGVNLEGRALSIVGAHTVSGVTAKTPCSTATTGPPTPSMATAESFTLLSSNGAVTNTGTTNVVGDVGTNNGSLSGFNPLGVTGVIHSVPSAITAQASLDLSTFYASLNALSPDIELLYPALLGYSQVLTPHVYVMNAAAVLTDTIFLDAQGVAGAIFVIRIMGALTTNANPQVVLIRGTEANNVFWQVEGAVTINSGNFNGIIVANNGAIVLNTGVSLNGKAFSTIGAITTANANITSTNSAVSVSLDTIESIINGNWSETSTWDCNCTPISSQNITINHQVILDNSFTTNDGSYLRINNNKSIDILSPFKLTIEGDLINSGSITGDLIIGGNDSMLVQLGEVENVEITNSINVLLSNTSIINRKLTLSNGYFNSNGYSLTLKSNPQGSALVVDNGGDFLGNLTIQKYLNNIMGYHFICSPFSNVTINELGDDFPLNLNTVYPNIYYYDETDTSSNSDDGWLAPINTNHQMGIGEGYSCWFNAISGTTLDMTGNINSGPMTISLTHTPNSTIDTSSCPPEGWNLIGNPYPSPLNFDLLLLSAPIEVEKALYLWNPTTKNYTSYVDGIGSPSSTTSIIPSFQGFWVKTTNNTSLNFDNSMRITNPDDSTNIFLKSSSVNAPIFRLEIEGQNQTEELVTRFVPNATTGFDSNYDAYFLASGYSNAIDFAAITGDGPVKINCLPPLQSNGVTIPLHYIIYTAENLSISMTEFTNFNNYDQIILEDTKLGVSHVLNNGNYSFYGSPNDSLKRFLIHVIPGIISAVNPLLEKSSLKIHKCVNSLCISLPEVAEQAQMLTIHNKLGQQVYSTTLNPGQQVYQLDNISLPSPNIYSLNIESLPYGAKFYW